TSIPEELGCPRTWDYRFCWLRDSAFVIEALRRLSHIQEGERFLMYLRDVAEAGPLQPVYGIGGERVLDEHILDHLSGYERCGPVRIGNAAHRQTQHDLMGELLLSLNTILTDERRSLEPSAFWSLIVRLVNDARRALWQPDTGIWEYRTEPKLHVFSQAMCWSALNSGSELAAMLGFRAEAEEWRRIANEAHPELVRRSYNPELGMFTQALEGSWSDAANLLLPVVNFISARSPEFRSTLAAYDRELVKNGLMQRYRHTDDFGMPGSTFTICSFWWAEALALSGELDAAITVFERLLQYSNALGLFSEDIDPVTSRMLGNYPQAYTHVGLINAAVTIGTLKAARDEKVAPWQ
ncbi:MAG TPA: glycoside hydrolase family 15 protein, partial [Thermoanaerobaculia bacterium]